MSKKLIDLNADLGEGAGADAELMQIVSSASIAAGGHAGDAQTIRHSMRLAMRHGVRVGVHPGFADPEHFGRRRLDLPEAELTRQISEQTKLFATIAADEGVPVSYVKLHGALANMAAEDARLAELALRAVIEIMPGLAVLALDASAQIIAAEMLGLPIIGEAFADRGYGKDGLLLPRSTQGGMLAGQAALDQCVRLATKGEIVAIDGTIIRSNARSICLHGDSPGALALATQIKAALGVAGISISS